MSNSSAPKVSLASMQFFLTSCMYLERRKKEISTKPSTLFQVPPSPTSDLATALKPDLIHARLLHAVAVILRLHAAPREDEKWTVYRPSAHMEWSGRAFTLQYSCSCLCKGGSGTAPVHEGLWEEWHYRHKSIQPLWWERSQHFRQVSWAETDRDKYMNDCNLLRYMQYLSYIST